MFKKIGGIFLIFILLTVILGAGIYLGRTSVVCDVCQPADINFSLFWSAYNTLKERFVDPSKLTEQTILYGAIAGLAESLGDPYTVFFTPADAKKFQDDLTGSFEGLGIEIGIKNHYLTIVAPLEGTPAQRAGLRPGDIILKINGAETAGISIDEAVNQIRGKKGTAVTLSIFREDWTKSKDFSITRDTINVPSLEWTIIEGDIAKIKISQFSQNLPTEFNKMAHNILNNKNIKRLILDLRGNPGGYLEVSQTIAGWLLEEDQIVVIEDFGQSQTVYKANGNSQLSSYPIVVLINTGSASASEILAGALKDNRDVVLVGEKSFGKGSVQEGIMLKDGSFLKVTVAKWLTPKGNSISDKGLDPDVQIELTEEDYDNDRDPQLQKAIEIVKELL
ncbi:PDZ domain-containing protein [Patescibacteria group bacterium]|nr:PDZ domain-containing protein [Patescibacteria group bacterium]